MEDETDPGSSGKLVEREVARVTVDGGSELGAEFGDDGEDDVALQCERKVSLGKEIGRAHV